ncbi:MAG TPA: hypothetical protein G4O18_06660 [Dehalococcoidia bacterium]|nr:hypothetical protein [Dehalococcoidia bacterium]
MKRKIFGIPIFSSMAVLTAICILSGAVVAAFYFTQLIPGSVTIETNGEISVTPDSLELGTMYRNGTTDLITFTVTNEGDVPLKVSAISDDFESAVCAGSTFDWNGDGASAPGTSHNVLQSLAVGASDTVTLEITIGSTCVNGEKGFTISFHSQDP